MDTFLSHPLNPHSLCRLRALDDFLVGSIDIDHSLGWMCFWATVNILWRRKVSQNSMKPASKGRLADRFSKRIRIAEEQCLVLVQREVGNESSIRSEFGYLAANVVFNSTLNVLYFPNVVEVDRR